MNNKYNELLGDIENIGRQLETLSKEVRHVYEGLMEFRVLIPSTVDGPDVPKCGHVYQDNTGTDYVLEPCILPRGHSSTVHEDANEDEWHENSGYYPKPDPMEVGRATHEAAEAYVGTSDCAYPEPTAVDKYLGGSKPKCGNVCYNDHYSPCVLKPGHQDLHVAADGGDWLDIVGCYPYSAEPAPEPAPAPGPESWSDDVKKAVLGCVLGVQVPRESFDAAFSRFVAYAKSIDPSVVRTHPGEVFARISGARGEIAWVDRSSGRVWGDGIRSVGTIYGPPEGYGLVVENGTVRVGGKS